MAKAQYIHYDSVGKQLIAVYGDDVDRNELEGITRELVSATKASVSLSHLGLNHPDVQGMNLLTMRTGQGVDEIAAVNRMRELTQPELPYTTMTLTMVILECTCGLLATRTDMTLVNGLQPNDPETFWIAYHASIKRVKVDASFREPPHTPLVNAIREMLRELGVHVSGITICPMPDYRPCTHQR